MVQGIPFRRAAILAAPGDNCAIATRKLVAGTVLDAGRDRPQLDRTILEGHRFSIQSIRKGDQLLSWGLPFGTATRDIHPFEYVINRATLDELRIRQLDFPLPAEPNFKDESRRFRFEESAFVGGRQVPVCDQVRHFQGYRRSPRRGVGTRSHIVLMAVSSLASTFATLLEQKLRRLDLSGLCLDGIVRVAHTEGGEERKPNNYDLLLRTLAGFVVHPNVAAVLLLDEGSEPVSNSILAQFMKQRGYPLDEVPHEFFSLRRSLEQSLRVCEEIVTGWLQSEEWTAREPQPISGLKVALQCGGSDAFSGVSANPLAGWVAKEIIRYGGGANLAETDELMGAESYVLANVRDQETALRFLEAVERFRIWASWHGHNAEANLSGGNRFRGLYNITLKSIGAAMKRLPEVRLDAIIKYAEPMKEPGYYFMDSPGNDLESIAGQVASGCNLIFFSTGNGSITNFPFVPTLKIVSTSSRYRLLENEMDVNAGEIIDGTSLEAVGARMFDRTVEVASGGLTKGEAAQHWQVSIWRDWRQEDSSRISAVGNLRKPTGKPVRVSTGPKSAHGFTIRSMQNRNGCASDRVALIIPNSLCSGQVSRMVAERLAASGMGAKQGIHRVVSLVHTEGCGVSSGSSLDLFTATLLGYLRHPFVSLAVFLEHGCEKAHNDFFRSRMSDAERNSEEIGFFSIQRDGGLEQAISRIEKWYQSALSRLRPPLLREAGLECVKIGLLTSGPASDAAARAWAGLTSNVVAAGGTVIVPEADGILTNPAYWRELGVRISSRITPTLDYSQRPENPGLHVMECPTSHSVEILTGLGACGVEVFCGLVAKRPFQAHPMIPILQITEHSRVWDTFEQDLDLRLEGRGESWDVQILEEVARVMSGDHSPSLFDRGYCDFQVTRGWFGISM